MTTDQLTAAVNRLFEVMRRTPYVPRDIAIAAADIRVAMNAVRGSDLAARRTKAGLSQAALGKLWVNAKHPDGVSKMQVGRVERQEAPTPATVAAYMAALRKAEPEESMR